MLNDPTPPYNKPPIIEAVIALHFVAPLEQKDIDTFARKSKKSFPFSEDIIEMSTIFNPQTKQQASNVRKIGNKLNSADRTRLIIAFNSTQFGVIQQAP